MLSNKHIHEEIKKIDEVIDVEKNETAKANLKATSIVIKLLHNIRTNMVTIMRHFNINLVESKKEEEKTDSTEVK